MTTDEVFMQRALELAVRAQGRTSPNPVVGAVIVSRGRVLAEGYHRKAGLPHAEVEALRNSDVSVQGATLYVNLEPCAHFGRTPPCVEALIGAKVRRVVVGITDPNPEVRGRGIRRLRRAGIDVVTGVLREVCKQVNEDFFTTVRTGRPFVTLKLAASLDGRIATSSGDARWISGKSSRRLVHELRDRVDAVMVGAETVKADDPQLTCRIRGGRDPFRVIIDGRLRTDPKARVCSLSSKAKTIIVTTPQAARSRGHLFGRLPVEIEQSKSRRGILRLAPILDRLRLGGAKHVMVEGGGVLAAAALKEGLVDKVLFFYNPLLIGSEGRAMVGPLRVKKITEGIKLHKMQYDVVGEDIVLSGYVKNKE